jgi:hypothetical protein
MEMRTGKTRTALAIANELVPKYIWIVCPKSGGATAEVWWKEVGKWLKKHRELRETTFYVNNFEQYVSQRAKFYKLSKEIGDDLLFICDESHYLKSRGATRSAVVRRIAKHCRYRVAMTGTPIAQGIQDAWAQFNFIDPTIFGKFDNTYEDPKTRKVLKEEGFEGRYLIYGGYKKHDVVGFRNEDEFYRLFHRYSYRKTLREARDTPLRLKYTRVRVKLNPRTRTVYEELKADLVTEVNKRRIRVKNVLACIIKLQQVTGGSVLTAVEDSGIVGPAAVRTELVDIGDEKIEALIDLLPKIEGKFIVVARFRHEMDRIHETLHSMGYKTALVRGGSPYDGKFREDGLILQVQSGVAVDMSHADAIIFFSIDFSMINFEQVRFRILDFHKPQGHYFFLAAEDTVDEQIHVAVTRKRNLAKLVCDTHRIK